MAEIAVLDAGVEKDELPEVGEDAGPVGEVTGIREMKESEVEATELGAAEDVGGEGHVHGWWLADEDEVLDAPAARNRDHSPSLRSWTPKKQ